MKDGKMRRYMAEVVGTFSIVFAPVALAATGRFHSGDGGLMAAAWVSGLAVLAMIYALGHISAAHFNPAVTLGLKWADAFPGVMFCRIGSRNLPVASLQQAWQRCSLAAGTVRTFLPQGH